jgi:hypothetical protein
MFPQADTQQIDRAVLRVNFSPLPVHLALEMMLPCRTIGKVVPSARVARMENNAIGPGSFLRRTPARINFPPHLYFPQAVRDDKSSGATGPAWCEIRILVSVLRGRLPCRSLLEILPANTIRQILAKSVDHRLSSPKPPSEPPVRPPIEFGLAGSASDSPVGS